MPTKTKEMNGNPGKRTLNEREAKPMAKIPSCPQHLSAEARKEWRRISRELFTLGLLTVVDRAALAGYCQAWARWVEAERAMAEPGFTMVEHTENGYAYVSPWISISNNALRQMRGFLVEFGMTPSSRSRAQTADSGVEPSLAEILFADVL